MVEVENRVRGLVQKANERGYSIPALRISWQNKLRRATIRIKVTPWPDYDSRRGESRFCYNGSIEVIEKYIDSLPEL